MQSSLPGSTSMHSFQVGFFVLVPWSLFFLPFLSTARWNECAFVQIKAICTNIKYSINKAGIFNHDTEILRIALTLIILQEGFPALSATAP